MQKIAIVLLNVLALGFACMPGAFGLEFTYVPIDVPGASATSLSGINNAGHIVGGSQLPNQAFVYSDGNFTPLAVPGASTTGAFDINNSGHVVGSFSDGTNPTQGFRYDGSSFTSINSPNGQFLQASGINDTGHVVGAFATTIGTLNSQQGFLLSPNGTYSVLTVPDSTFTDAMGINNAGEIVGRFRDAGFAEHGFLYSGGIYSPITVPGALWTNASGINTFGDIVGSFHDGTTIRGFHYSSGLFSIINPDSSVLTNAWGINDTGYIVGTFYGPGGGHHGFVASPVPLPAALPLFATGFALISLALRLRRSRKGENMVSADERASRFNRLLPRRSRQFIYRSKGSGINLPASSQPALLDGHPSSVLLSRVR